MADLKKLHKVIDDLEKQSIDLEAFNKIYAEMGDLKNDLSSNLDILKNNNDKIKEIENQLSSSLKDYKTAIDDTEKTLLERIQDLYQDNKNFQKELDSSILTRLDKHKSDIQVDLRNEGTQIQRAFETSLSKSFEELRMKIDNELAKQTSQLSFLKYISIASLVVLIILILVPLLK